MSKHNQNSKNSWSFERGSSIAARYTRALSRTQLRTLYIDSNDNFNDFAVTISKSPNVNRLVINNFYEKFNQFTAFMKLLRQYLSRITDIVIKVYLVHSDQLRNLYSTLFLFPNLKKFTCKTCRMTFSRIFSTNHELQTVLYNLVNAFVTKLGENPIQPKFNFSHITFLHLNLYDDQTLCQFDRCFNLRKLTVTTDRVTNFTNVMMNVNVFPKLTKLHIQNLSFNEIELDNFVNFAKLRGKLIRTIVNAKSNGCHQFHMSLIRVIRTYCKKLNLLSIDFERSYKQVLTETFPLGKSDLKSLNSINCQLFINSTDGIGSCSCCSTFIYMNDQFQRAVELT